MISVRSSSYVGDTFLSHLFQHIGREDRCLQCAFDRVRRHEDALEERTVQIEVCAKIFADTRRSEPFCHHMDQLGLARDITAR